MASYSMNIANHISLSALIFHVAYILCIVAYVLHFWLEKKEKCGTLEGGESLIYSQYYKHHGIYNSKQAQKHTTENRCEKEQKMWILEMSAVIGLSFLALLMSRFQYLKQTKQI